MESTKTRTKGTELKDIKLSNWKNAFDKLGWKYKASPVSRLMVNYKPDRSKKRLISNMTWMNEFIKRITENINTRSSRIYRLQKWLIGLYPEEHKKLIRNSMILSKKDYFKKRAIAQASLDNRSVNMFTITKEDLLKVIDNLKSHNGIADSLFLIQLATGRRKIEVLKIADLPEKKGKSIVFTRLSKKHKDGLFKVPLFHLTHKKLIERWKALRHAVKNDIKGKDNIQIGAMFRKDIDESLKRIGLSTHGTHIFRKLYVAWALQFKPKRWTDGVYIKKILAHGSGQEVENYSNVRLGETTEMTKAISKQKRESSDVRDNMKKVIIKMMKEGEKLTARNVKSHGFGSVSYTKHFKNIIAEIS